MKIKGVIFDADGTLLDSMRFWMEIGSRFLLEIGKRPEPGLGQKLFTMTTRESVTYLKEAYRLDMSFREMTDGLNRIARNFYFKEVTLKPGVLETLKWLEKQGIPAAVATATDEEPMEGALNHLGIRRYFRAIYTCTGVGIGKNDSPLIYQRAAETLGSLPEETLVVEDALHALLTAKGAGFFTAGIYDPSSEHKQEKLRMEADIYGLSMWEILEEIQKRIP